jgi:hypothetical protein
VRIDGYFAVTSNTVQFGAHAEVFFGIDEINVDGDISFDALFQFSPFAFITEVSASFSVKVLGIGLFSVRVHGTLEGPTPYRARGEGSISLLFFDISVDFDVSWGEQQDTTLPCHRRAATCSCRCGPCPPRRRPTRRPTRRSRPSSCTRWACCGSASGSSRSTCGWTRSATSVPTTSTGSPCP